MANHPKTGPAEDHEYGDPFWDAEHEVALRLEPAASERASFVSRTTREPSRRLMLAVLADAIATFRRTAVLASRDDERTFAETAHWFASDDSTEPFSFLSICATLGLDSGYLREGLKSIRSRARLARRRAVRVLH
jgi:hypothetical protein